MATITVPREDINEAIRRGYPVIRVMCTANSDGEIIDQHTQIRTGFDLDTGRETWEDLHPVEPSPLDALLQRAAERAKQIDK